LKVKCWSIKTTKPYECDNYFLFFEPYDLFSPTTNYLNRYGVEDGMT